MEFHVFTNFGVQILNPRAVFKPPAEKPWIEEFCELWQELVLDGHVSIARQFSCNELFGLDYLIDPQGGYVELGAGG
jgi:hypothetical protein